MLKRKDGESRKAFAVRKRATTAERSKYLFLIECIRKYWNSGPIVLPGECDAPKCEGQALIDRGLADAVVGETQTLDPKTLQWT
ncbi:MAG: hypothetical protein K0U72_05620 [Gammaproteobacteria bacterium]|nr:hypothetical protein [Gammaproteobacteria bacterium]